MSEKIRAGVIGVGVGEYHIRGYEAHPAAEVVALADVNPVRLAEAGAAHGITRLYTDYQAMLAQPDIDVISVALPNALHAPVAIAALDAGKHVLCEKPLALNATEAQAIVDHAHAASRQLMVCFNYRMRPDARWLKAALAAGRLGDVYAAKAGWLRNTGIPGANTWFTRREMSGGGPLIDLGVHMLDLTLWLLDYPQITAVSGVTFAKFGPRGKKSWSYHQHLSGPVTFDVEDLALALIRLADGRAITLEVSWASHTRSGRDDYFVTLYGDEGGADLYVANYADRDTVALYTEMHGEPVDVRPGLVVRGSGHDAAVAHFVESILANRPVEAPGEQGVALQRLIDALYLSAAEGREVWL